MKKLMGNPAHQYREFAPQRRFVFMAEAPKGPEAQVQIPDFKNKGDFELQNRQDALVTAARAIVAKEEAALEKQPKGKAKDARAERLQKLRSAVDDAKYASPGEVRLLDKRSNAELAKALYTQLQIVLDPNGPIAKAEAMLEGMMTGPGGETAIQYASRRSQDTDPVDLAAAADRAEVAAKSGSITTPAPEITGIGPITPLGDRKALLASSSEAEKTAPQKQKPVVKTAPRATPPVKAKNAPPPAPALTAAAETSLPSNPLPDTAQRAREFFLQNSVATTTTFSETRNPSTSNAIIYTWIFNRPDANGRMNPYLD